jgi:exonuclease VII small subunit
MTTDDLTPSTLTTAPESYAAGEAELDTIARAIEQGAIPIDKLSLAVKRADFLNRHLEQQLVNIEQDLKQLGLQPNHSGETKPNQKEA